MIRSRFGYDRLIAAADRLAPRAMNLAREARDAAHIALTDTLVRKVLPSEPWFIDEMRFEPEGLHIRGWALPPRAAEPEMRVNGRPFDRFAREPRPDVGAVIWPRRVAAESGFRASARAAPSELFRDGYLEIAYANSPARLPGGLRHSWFLLDPALEPALPDADQRFRVLGNRDELGFRLTGATDFRRIDRAVRVFAGRDIADFASVLDWGCGCGRVARYASRAVGERFFGCDIDRANLAWCADNLPGAFAHTGMRPPLPYRDGHFELVYGVSVFTHFGVALQDAWLAELRRIVRPGGFVLVTTHGRTAMDYAGMGEHEYVRLRDDMRAQGLLVAGKNEQLDGAAEGATEYLNVYHSPRYIERHWSRGFAIRAIVPGFVFTHDLVVMQRRA